MSQTTVFGCDWCQEIVDKNQYDGNPKYAAKVTIEQLNGAKFGQPNTVIEEEICQSCRQNLQALREGKVRRR